ncbi:MAG: hypothetical protein D6790_10070 [Caldilineae bacterium]|nr:MAG: hypothetical protein D6790_10070 [Caldilineae bacterium]
MATYDPNANLQILLSREELLFVLDLLQANFLPGMEEDTEGEMDNKLRDVVFRVARRALQARELVRRRANGEYALHNSLLRTIGVCAYAQSRIFVYHWPSQGDAPVRTYFHIRGNDSVLQSQPEPGLHRFLLLPLAQAPAQVAASCQIQVQETEPEQTFYISNTAFQSARQQMADGHVQAAQEILTQAGASATAAARFTAALAPAAAVSILQMVRQNGSGVQRQDFTVIQHEGRGWIVEPANPGDSSRLRVQSFSPARFQEILGL